MGNEKGWSVYRERAQSVVESSFDGELSIEFQMQRITIQCLKVAPLAWPTPPFWVINRREIEER